MSVKSTRFLTGNGVSFATGNGFLLAFGSPNSLIFIKDRTQEDVNRVKYLRQKGWQSMTADERREYLSGLKGSYNASDLNRVEYNVKVISEALFSLPETLQKYGESISVAWDKVFDLPYDKDKYDAIETKQDWADSDIITTQEAERYIKNVLLVKSAFPESNITTPLSLEKLNFFGANAIEKSLELAIDQKEKREKKVKGQMDRISKSFFYSAEIYGGEV